MVTQPNKPSTLFDSPSRRTFVLLTAGAIGTMSGCTVQSDTGSSNTPQQALDCSNDALASHWPMGQFDSQNTGSVRARSIPEDASVTSVDLGSRIIATPVLADGNVVAATKAGILYVVSPDGTVQENYDLGAGDIDVPPAIGCGGIFCQTGRTLKALDGLSSLNTAWTTAHGNAGSSPLLNLHNGTLYAVTPSELVAIDATSGDVRWSKSNDRGYWEGAAIDDAVYAIRGEPDSTTSDSSVTYTRASVRAFDLNGEAEWKLEGIDETHSSPVLDPNHVYVTTTTGTILTIQKETGDIKWEHDLTHGGHVYTSPSVDDDRIYAYDGDGGHLVALSKRDGEKRWDKEVTNAKSSPVVVGSEVYAGNRGGPVSRINATDGSISQTWPVTPTSGFAVGTDFIAVGTPTGLALIK